MFSFFVPIIYDDGLKSALTCSTWAKRSRFSQVLAVSTVGTSRSRAPSGRSRNQLQSNVFLFFADYIDDGQSRRSRAPRGLNDLSFLKCWRCPPLARRGHEPHLGALVTDLGKTTKVLLVLAYYLSERVRRPRTHEAETISALSVLAVLHRWHVAVTSPIWALSWPAWTQRQTIFLPILAEYLFGADESALTCSTRPKRSRLSQCWRCTPLARRGHGPHVGALVTDLDSAANAPSSNCRCCP